MSLQTTIYVLIALFRRLWSRYLAELLFTTNENELLKVSCMATAGAKGEDSASATYARVVRTGVPRAHGGRSNRALIQIPFLFIILGTVGLGGLNATRAYKKQKEEHPSHNPFLPWCDIRSRIHLDLCRGYYLTSASGCGCDYDASHQCGLAVWHAAHGCVHAHHHVDCRYKLIIIIIIITSEVSPSL